VPPDLIVVDIAIPQFMDDKVLDAAQMSRYPGGSVYTRLVEVARSRGWEVTTADRFLATRPPFRKAVTLSNEFTGYLRPLLALGVKPGLLWSGESPNVAESFYRSLPRGSEPFRHACLFRGCLARLHPSVNGHPLFWPVPPDVDAPRPPWAERRLLAMVAAFKGVWRSPQGMIWNFPRDVGRRWAHAREPSTRFQDLYGLRLEVVRRLAPHGAFVLRGMGWERTLEGQTGRLRRPIRYANAPAPCDDKLEILGGSRYAMAIENAAYPGYVTEKIFDAFRAGTVPVYLGAPDIADFVPEDCFVDYRKHGTPERLWTHLREMPEGRWVEYRQAAMRFLGSARYDRHRELNVAMQWMDWLADAAG